MKKANQLLALAVIAAVTAAGFTSCGKREVTATISFQMSGSQATVPQKTSANTLVFNSGHVFITEIVFDGDRKGKSDVSITHEQVSKIDLATGIADPPVNIEIPVGTYTSVNLGIEILDDDDIAPISVLAEGTYTDGNSVAWPIRFEFNSGEVFEADTDVETKVKPGTSPLMKIDFDPLSWFATITSSQLDNADRDGNGVIVISDSMNSSIFDIVADKLDDRTEAVFQ